MECYCVTFKNKASAQIPKREPTELKTDELPEAVVLQSASEMSTARDMVPVAPAVSMSSTAEKKLPPPKAVSTSKIPTRSASKRTPPVDRCVTPSVRRSSNVVDANRLREKPRSSLLLLTQR